MKAISLWNPWAYLVWLKGHPDPEIAKLGKGNETRSWYTSAKDIDILRSYLRQISLDDYIAWMLDNGFYDASLETGDIISCRKNRTMARCIDRDGYYFVVLYFDRKLQRNVRAHRIVAIKSYGVEAVRGKQVGHKDSDRTNNKSYNLWLPNTQKEHFIHDGLEANLIRGQKKCKENWEPCVRCGDPNGQPYYGRVTPARTSGLRFGFNGKICWRCYRALYERERRRKQKGVG